jgi:diacylglycerol O-acyltransferase
MAPDEEALRFDERMSDLESLMWRLEQVEPSLLSTMTLIAVFDGPLDRDRLAEKFEMVTRKIPRLRDHVEASRLPMAPPAWEPDPEFSVDNHVAWFTAAPPGDFASLLRVAEERVRSGFEPERPPWHLGLVDGLEGGKEAMVARLHHSYTDGQGALRIAMELFDFQAEPQPASSLPELPPPPMLPLLGHTVADVLHEASRTASVLRGVAPWLVNSLRSALTDPERIAGPARALLRSVGELAGEALRPGSSLLTKRGTDIRMSGITLDLEQMRRAARLGGGKINDAFLAGVLGGLARYHEMHGDPSTSVRLGIPVSTRSDGIEMRNQLQGILMHGPLDLANPLERLKILHDTVLHTRSQPWLDFIDAGAAAALRVPRSSQLLAGVVRSTDALVSNVPGPPVPLYLAGASVERLVPFGPRIGSALNLTLLSYQEKASIGINSDPTAVTDPDVLLDCLGAGFDEVLALA